ncbi:hypothetical protein [Pedococcus bigeumensis]|uniref:Uncharacterized protein n=1 Tax=Pedococcus bigeumensis TaxID=433644 RepID=A0A502CW47_9MICO|nr:hypothetical protein [Pedococcus bigeumensis]TPG17033.1 hypothetical protein EAH86_09665 [Pedococcus bigeumensis]
MKMGLMDDAALIPYWLAFLIGPVLLAFAAWVLPAQFKEAQRQVPFRRVSSAAVNDAVDAWFPAIWAAGMGVIGTVFVLGGLFRLAGVAL